jgi:iron complex outermembrane receptor protein
VPKTALLGTVALGAALALATTDLALAATKQPAAPYYSIELGRATTREQALAWLRQFGGPAPARAEVRRTGFYLRAGAWRTRAEAEAARKSLGGRLATDTRILQIENPAPWLVASGETVPVPGATPATAEKPQPAPAAPAAAAATGPAAAANPPAAAARSSSPDLTGLDLDQLMSMEVTGITRRAGSYAKAPAAIFVLTGEDIRRSGARTIADALRLVPGLQVIRTNSQSYTVTARGFGGDKLQVLLDDRSVYTPLTSTVFWDVFDTYLDDIARIEVIRGPGASVYGANAVNGVINIVTKPAGDSQGTHLHGGGGNEELAFGGFRSGGRIGEWGHGRAYAKGRERDSTERADGSEVHDGQSQVQAGGRVDTNLGDLGALAVQGDVYRARLYSATFPPSPNAADTIASGRNLNARWTLDWDGGAQTQASLYYDGYDRFIPTVFKESRDTYDINLQHNLADWGPNRITVGTGARLSRDETGGPPLILVFEPARTAHRTYHAFAQDEIVLGDFSFVAGAKVEHNDFSGTEFQPGIRAGWSLAQTLFTWASVARATRTPNRLDHDTGLVCSGVDVPVPGCPGAGSVLAVGSKDFESEKLVAYEWGLRAQPARTLVADLALFYNDYDDLRSTESGLRFGNFIEAQSFGGELAVAWEPLDWLALHAFYGYLQIDARSDAASTDANTAYGLENGTGNQSVGLRLGLRPLDALTADAFVRHVDNLGGRNAGGAFGTDRYTELNLRLGWAVTPFMELALVGENLLDHSHPEAVAAPATRSEIPRSLFGELTWRWQ